MNILLINPPIRLRQPPYQHPIGLASVAGSLRDAGHEVTILDLNIHRDGATLPREHYGLIGISGLITTYAFVRELVPQLRQAYPGVPVVLGGGGVTSAPNVYLNTIHPDYIVLGEGEHAVIALVEAIERKGPLPATPLPLERNLDNFHPAYDLLDMDAYLNVVKYAKKAKREASFMATRGCPFSCSYCYHIFGQGTRYRSIENVAEELKLLKYQYRADALLISDECFTANKKFVKAFCKEIKPLNMEWMCYSRVDTVDEEIMPLMAEAGCNWVGFGLESGSPKILQAMNKKTTPKKMLGAIRTARKYMGVSGTMIFGYPGETDETVEETVRFCEQAQINPTLFYLQPYPGTKVFDEYQHVIMEKCGSLSEFFSQLNDAGDFVVNLTDWSDEEAFAKWQRTSSLLQTMSVLGWRGI